ncbi:MAG: biotin-dependent carboxyltransferase [Verrucomicrobia bacterium]|nr:biotin-dependent carboxyltransferase [Verrucomicrobiota bacterium]
MEIKIHRGGLQTTVQDLGRPGHRGAGVPLSGAMDPVALRVANFLVGNAENAAALEFVLVGPELEFSQDTVVALGGVEWEGLPSWQPVAVRAGERVKIGAAKRGCRGYLAVAGGIAVDPVMGSRSTYLRGGFGGFQGRALHDGDVLPLPAVTRQLGDHWRIDARVLPAYSAHPVVRVLRGAQTDEFGAALFGAEFKVSPQSDRMGLRLSGAALVRSSKVDLISSAVAPGTVQVPPDGQPIVLMADAQTIGGYPQAAHVISVDLPLMAQLRPGDTVKFAEVSLAEAQKLALAHEHGLALLREGLAQKLR